MSIGIKNGDNINYLPTNENTVDFEEATSLENISTGETHKTLFGKIKKLFSYVMGADTTDGGTKDSEDLITSGAVNGGLASKVNTSDVVNNFTTTEAGKVADARALKTLNDSLVKHQDVVVDKLGTLEIKTTPAGMKYIDITNRFTLSTNNVMIAIQIIGWGSLLEGLVITPVIDENDTKINLLINDTSKLLNLSYVHLRLSYVKKG